MIYKNKYGVQTRALHAGEKPDTQIHSRAVPVYSTTIYLFWTAIQAGYLVPPCASQVAFISAIHGQSSGRS
jgi:cystathionine beta-lyase/cystathionine gamma-synthase